MLQVKMASASKVATTAVRSVSGRLMVIAGLVMLTLAVVCSVTQVYIASAQDFARSIIVIEQRQARKLAELGVLLERHRRFVERARITQSRAVINDVRKKSEKLSSLMKGLHATSGLDTVESSAADLEKLIKTARQYFFHLKHQEQKIAFAMRRAYIATADRIMDQVRHARDQLMSRMSQSFAAFAKKSQVVERVTIVSVVLAILVVFPLAILMIIDLASRLRSVTTAMTRLAQGDTNIDIKSASTERQDEVGDMARALVVFRENAVKVHSHSEEIRRLNRWFDVALNNMAHGLSMFDGDGRLIVYNQKYLELYDLDPERIKPGMTFEDMMAAFSDPSENASGESEPVDVANWLAQLKADLVSNQSVHVAHELADGRTISVQYQAIAGGGWVDVHEDITEARQATEKITHLAQSDGLTGLANRKHFHSVLIEHLRGIDGSKKFAVLWLDLDRFKEVNDTYGHPAGDALIREVADRLRSIVRGDDLVSRLGGDEFAILMPAGRDPVRSASIVAERALDVLSRPFNLFGHSVCIGVSIGIAIAPEHGTSPDGLIRNADMALYRAKTTGRGTYVFYELDFERNLLARRGLERDLKRALGTDQLSLHYQPMVDLRSGKVTCVEALMRWNHPRLGAIPPSEFIPIAEDIGLIGRLGAWALHVACSDVMALSDEITVAVNLSADQPAMDCWRMCARLWMSVVCLQSVWNWK